MVSVLSFLLWSLNTNLLVRRVMAGNIIPTDDDEEEDFSDDDFTEDDDGATA